MRIELIVRLQIDVGLHRASRDYENFSSVAASAERPDWHFS
jgi:hypothetical protein